MMQLDYSKTPVSFTMTCPDDWHLHIRDGVPMAQVIGYSARQFARAIIMPNLKPPVTTVARARSYLQEINVVLNGIGLKENFQPLMTLYLTDNTTSADVREAKESRFVNAFKYYPAGATTNSDNGVTDIEKIYPALGMMEEVGMVLCIHGEVTDPEVDVFDREKVFLETLDRTRRLFPGIKIVLEHITTEEAAEYVWRNDDKKSPHQYLAATITAHHLLENRNALFKGGMRPHNYCLPILKHEKHRQALIKAATSGERCYFLGTDSAPHPQHLKENACGCAGCFTALHAMELYAEAFEEAKALDKLEAFASQFGADFYGLPRNTDTITLVREEWEIPKAVKFGDDAVVPFRAGEKLKWKMV
ncbi:MAG: dihydroorotase [bacterium]|nr:dihydroorotase [bacterium]